MLVIRNCNEYQTQIRIITVARILLIMGLGSIHTAMAWLKLMTEYK
jgi:hypothetical protein